MVDRFTTWLADLKASLRYYSQRMNVLASATIAYLVMYPSTLTDAAGYVPEAYRPIASAVAGFAMFLVVSWARLKKQPGITNA